MGNNESKLYNQIESVIDYKFYSGELLYNSLEHPSFFSSKTNKTFERLEFLGDRVLGLVIADFLYNNFSKESEGDLAVRLSELVSGKILLEIANKLDLKNIILIINNNKNNIVINDSILIDTVESLIGAIFIDGGLSKTRKFILNNWKTIALNYKTPPKDSKSLLQEWAMANNYKMPVYEKYGKKGPDHSPIFSVKVSIKSFGDANGKGLSKKMAEMDAATILYKQILNENSDE